MRQLAEEIIREGITKVSLERFETIIRHFDKINAVEGDIIECGVWKGGMESFFQKYSKTELSGLPTATKGLKTKKPVPTFLKMKITMKDPEWLHLYK